MAKKQVRKKTKLRTRPEHRLVLDSQALRLERQAGPELMKTVTLQAGPETPETDQQACLEQPTKVVGQVGRRVEQPVEPVAPEPALWGHEACSRRLNLRLNFRQIIFRKNCRS
ncbi:MAG: hypothetical protein Kow0029_26830 [Candidatus Rifleibacteriota bacterium]